MTIVTCINKTRNKQNKIISYTLRDQNNQIIEITPTNLKQAIKSGEVRVINLSLTPDNRLINKIPKAHTLSLDDQIQLQVNKARMLGIVDTINTYCKHQCYIIHKSEIEHILLIPSDVVQLNSNSKFFLEVTSHLQNLLGTIKVIGGRNLRDANNLFMYCALEVIHKPHIKGHIDVSELHTDKLENTEQMFSNCRASKITLGNFNTSQISNMNRMFNNCYTTHLDLSTFKTNFNTRIVQMFGQERTFTATITDSRLQAEYNKPIFNKLSIVQDLIIEYINNLRGEYNSMSSSGGNLGRQLNSKTSHTSLDSNGIKVKYNYSITISCNNDDQVNIKLIEYKNNQDAENIKLNIDLGNIQQLENHEIINRLKPDLAKLE